MVTVTAPTDTSVAARLAILVTAVIGVQLPVRLRAWDGSEAGPEDAPAFVIHYVQTVAFWLATLERRWAGIAAIVGEPTARVWRRYLVGGGLTFAEGRMGVDQILAVRPTVDGVSGLPAVRRYSVGSADA